MPCPHQSTEAEAGKLADPAHQVQCRLAGRHPTPSEANTSFNENLEPRSGLDSRGRKILGVLEVVYTYDDVREPRQPCQFSELACSYQLIGDQDVIDPSLDEGSCILELGARYPDRPRPNLLMGDPGRLVRLGVWSELARPVSEEAGHFLDISLDSVEVKQN